MAHAILIYVPVAVHILCLEKNSNLNLGISGFQNKRNATAQVLNFTRNFYYALLLNSDYVTFRK